MPKQIIKGFISQIRGVSYKPTDVVDAENGTPIIRANNIQDDGMIYDDLVFVAQQRIKDNQLLKKGDIVICTSSGSKNLVGKATTFSGYKTDMSFGAFCKVVRISSSSVNPDYIRLFFKSKTYREQISASSTGANINNIKTDHIDNLIINIPPVETQNIAVRELSTLIKSISIKKQQLSALNELVKSRFIEMFGDPLSNSKGYDLSDYGSLFELNAGGTPSKNKPEYWENGNISWIGSNMCQDTILYENDGKYITELGFNNSSARMFPKNTVLVALVGATIGKTALLKFETTTNQNVLGILGIEESGNNPYFVFYYTQGLHKFFMDISDGGFAMASKGFISKLPFPIVDISLQNDFADFVKLIDKSKFIVQKQIDDLQELLDSKMDEYFG